MVDTKRNIGSALAKILLCVRVCVYVFMCVCLCVRVLAWMLCPTSGR